MKVYFTGRENPDHYPTLTIGARILRIPDEKTLVVALPKYALEGPVKVCDHKLENVLSSEFLCSNTDVQYGALNTVSMVAEILDGYGGSIADGETVSGTVFVKGLVRDLPSDVAPESLVAYLSLNGQTWESKYLDTSGGVEFQIDTRSLPEGSYEVYLHLMVSDRPVESGRMRFKVGAVPDLGRFKTASIIIDIPGTKTYTFPDHAPTTETSTAFRFTSGAGASVEGDWSGREFNAIWDDERIDGNYYVGKTRITVHADGQAADFSTDWTHSLTDGSIWTHTAMNGINVPFDDSSSSTLMYFSAKGSEICSMLKHLEWKQISANSSGDTVGAFDYTGQCNSDSRILIRLR